jgi:hypothetical protein
MVAKSIGSKVQGSGVAGCEIRVAGVRKQRAEETEQKTEDGNLKSADRD